MAALQPDLGAKEGLEPLESDLEGSYVDGSNSPYLSPGQLWLVNYPVTPTMAAWHPDLWARESLEPLGSEARWLNWSMHIPWTALAGE